jgi:hypothetical protein
MIPGMRVLLAAAFAFAATHASAQSFPTKPVHILVPYAAGGAVDVLARTLGQALAPVIDNRPGAGGIIASQALIAAAPDGYTLMLVASGHPLNQYFYRKLPYDTFKDFTAITEVAYSPLAIVVKKDSPTKNLQELLAAARAKPESISYGMAGNGTSAHLASELLNHIANVKLVAIPYKGGAPAITAVVAGEIPMSARSRGTARRRHRAGAGGDHRPAFACSARRADCRRGGRGGLRQRRMVGLSRPRGHAGGSDGEDLQRHRDRAARPRCAGISEKDRFGSGRQLAQGIRCLYARRGGEMGARYQGREHHSTVKSPLRASNSPCFLRY